MSPRFTTMRAISSSSNTMTYWDVGKTIVGGSSMDSYIVDGGELLRSDATGTIVAPGRIGFPTSCLTRHIKGEQNSTSI